MLKEYSIYSAISKKVQEFFKPITFNLIDESYKHAGHTGVADSKSAETHFNMVLISDKFDGLSHVSRHRLVYSLLNAEFESGLHSLSMKLYTPSEYVKKA